MKPLWKFSRHGECGHWGSALFPEINRHVDDLCFIHSMHTEGWPRPATLFLHCGATNLVRPSMVPGSCTAWAPRMKTSGFVSIAPSTGMRGPELRNAFLPAVYQGTPLGKAGGPASQATIRNLGNPLRNASDQRRQFELLREFNAEQLHRVPGDSELEAIAASYELAWRMQSNAPRSWTFPARNPETLALYGSARPRPTTTVGSA